MNKRSRTGSDSISGTSAGAESATRDKGRSLLLDTTIDRLRLTVRSGTCLKRHLKLDIEA
jgi:hypothetical protein